MEAIRGFVAFLAGLFIVGIGVLHECPRVGAVIVGLLLMGMFTVPEAVSLIRGKVSKEDDE